MPKRVSFFIDGFNIYHSIVSYKKDTGKNTKWLNLYSLCKSYIYLFGKDTILKKVYYFSVYAHYLGDETVRRHKNYAQCLTDCGVIPIMGHFKEK